MLRLYEYGGLFIMIVELKDILGAVVGNDEGRSGDGDEFRIEERIGFELDG